MAIGFYFDMTRCIGCRACQVACKDKNRLDVGMTFRNAHTYSTGSFPSVDMFSCTFSCNHCDEPACVANCPTGAMFKSEDGAVLHQDDVCIGCKTCVNSCPYQVPVIDEEQGISRKCDSCIAIRTAGGQPACVAGCPNRALDFGEIEDLKAKYGEDLVNETTVHPDPSMTGPSLLIKVKDAATSGEPTEVAW